MGNFGLDQYEQLSGIQNNTQAFFSTQSEFCESKEAYNKKKKKAQKHFSAKEELESLLFSEEDPETKAFNEKTQVMAHRAADVGSNVITKLAGKGLAKAFVKPKSGMFGKLRTRMARKRFARNFGNQFGGAINSATHMGAAMAHEHYLKV
jgi:hypothetical protein